LTDDDATSKTLFSFTPHKYMTHSSFCERLRQEQNKEVGKKLGLATALMFTLPIAVFYICLEIVFKEKKDPTMWAGGCAVIVTNMIVAGYVVSAFSEPDDLPDEHHTSNNGEIKRKDEVGPRVGVFKIRTD